jgi:glycosyltransferase involved in cell wall biosynthesis
MWRYLETRLINKADKVITINESIADELCKRYAISRPDIIRNVAPLPKAPKRADLRLLFGFPADWKLLIYQGVLRKGQGLIELLHIMISIDDGIGLLIIGDGPIEVELKNLVKEYRLAGRVKFAGRVNPDMLASFTSGADAGALLMEDVALNNKLALPQKLFQYLAAGIPQIVSPMPEISAFVEKEKTGITVPLNNSPKSARMISEFLSDHAALALCKANCSKSAQLNNWEIESRRLIELYRILEHKK